MADRFQSQRTVEANSQRILGEQLDKALYQLTEHFGDDPAGAIHDARKRLKKPWSALRLVRKASRTHDYGVDYPEEQPSAPEAAEAR